MWHVLVHTHTCSILLHVLLSGLFHTILLSSIILIGGVVGQISILKLFFCLNTEAATFSGVLIRVMAGNHWSIGGCFSKSDLQLLIFLVKS